MSDKDSPYALIDKYFPERESYFYQNKDKFVEEYRGQETKTDIGNISPSEVTDVNMSLQMMGKLVRLKVERLLRITAVGHLKIILFLNQLYMNTSSIELHFSLLPDRIIHFQIQNSHYDVKSGRIC